MRNYFQPQQYSQLPPQHQPHRTQQSQPMRGPDPRGQGPDLYASTNSVGSDGAMSVLSNAEDFSFDPGMVPANWYQQQPQYQVIEIERPSPERPPMHRYHHQQPIFAAVPPKPVQYMQHAPQPRFEYMQAVQQPMPQQHVQQHMVQQEPRMQVQQQQPAPQAPIIATIGVALWQQGRYFAIASITPGSDASRCGLKVRYIVS